MYLPKTLRYTYFLNRFSKDPRKRGNYRIKSYSYRTVYYSQLLGVVKFEKRIRRIEILALLDYTSAYKKMTNESWCLLYWVTATTLCYHGRAQKNYFKKEYLYSERRKFTNFSAVQNVRCSLFQLLQVIKQAIYVEAIDLVNTVSLDILNKAQRALNYL